MPRTSPPDPDRLLMIKTKACQRLGKEVAHYYKEVTENETEWKNVEADPTKDEYDAKRFRDIWEESVRMVPDAERRHTAALQDLAAHTEQYFVNGDDNEWLPVARQLLQQSAPKVDPSTGENGGGIGGELTNVEDLADGEVF